MRIFEDITRTIGNTPLVKLRRVTKGCLAEVVGKLESFNPLSCVKDRIALSMIEAAEKENRIGPEDGDHRAHFRQHRNRPGLRLRLPRIPVDPGHAGDHEPGAAQAA